MKNYSLYGCNFIILLSFFSVLLIFIINYYTYNKYQLKNCIINNINYPNNIIINSTGYIPCNSLNSTYQICISIYGNLNNKIILFQNEVSNKIDHYCTFRNSKCLQNFTFENIQKSIDIGNKYKKVIEENKTIECWIDPKNKNLYLYNNNYVNINIILMFISLIIIIILIILNYYFCNYKKYTKLHN